MMIAIRLRSKAPWPIEEAMKRINLKRIHNCSLVPKNEYGQLKKAKDYITFGDPSVGVVEKLIVERGEFLNGRKEAFNDNDAKALGYSSVRELAEALCKDEITWRKVANKLNMRKFFRLNSPRGEIGSRRLPYPKGALGYRGYEINDVVLKMLYIG